MTKYTALFMLLLLPMLMVSQAHSECVIDGETVPEWVCNTENTTESVINGVGIGTSYHQAMINGLCEINNSSFSVHLSKGKVETSVSKQNSRHSVGKNILVESSYKSFFSAKEGNVHLYRCKVDIESKTGKIHAEENLTQLMENDDTTITTDSQYTIPSHLDIETSLKESGVDLKEIFVSKKHQFYILMNIQKSTFIEK